MFDIATRTGSVIAGSLSAGFQDGAGLSQAKFQFPVSVTADPRSDTLYVADFNNHRVRRVLSTAASSFFVSSPINTAGISGSDDGDAAQARLNVPWGVCWDPTSNAVVIGDTSNHVVRRFFPDTGVVETLAGTAGMSVLLDGTGPSAWFNNPRNCFVTPAGVIYVADTFNHAIRRLVCPSASPTPTSSPTPTPGGSPSRTPTPSPSPTASMTATPSATPAPWGCWVNFTAGAGAGFAAGAGTDANMSSPEGLALDAFLPTMLAYLADAGNHRVRSVVLSGPLANSVQVAVVGTGVPGWADGVAGAAQVSAPRGLATDVSSGRVYIADTGNSRVRWYDPNDSRGPWVGTLAGSGATTPLLNGAPTLATFNGPMGVACTAAGDAVFVADTTNHAIRAINVSAAFAGSQWAVSTLAGSGLPAFSNGVGAGASFSFPQGLALNPTGTTLFVTDNFRIRAIDVASRGVTTLSGTGVAGFLNGMGLVAQFSTLGQVAYDAFRGALLVADAGNNRVRLVAVTPDGSARTLAGTGVAAEVDGWAPSAAQLQGPRGVVALAATGEALVATTAAHRLRRITCTSPSASPTPTPSASVGASASATPSPTATALPTAPPTPSPTPSPRAGCAVVTVAGLPGVAGLAGGVGSAARFSAPSGLAIDATEAFVLVADSGNNRVVLFNASASNATALAGSPTGAAGSTDAPFPFAALFSGPSAVAINADQTALYVADTTNNKIRSVVLYLSNGTAGAVATLAGSGVAGTANGVGAAATFSAPRGLAVWAAGATLFVTDTGGHRVRAVSLPGATVTYLAGSGLAGSTDGVGISAAFNAPWGLALTPAGDTLYVADSAATGNRLRAVAVASGAVTTLAGGGNAICADGMGTGASLNAPAALALTPAGALLATDASNTVRSVAPSGDPTVASPVSTLLSSCGAPPGSADGMGAAALLYLPRGLAVGAGSGVGYVTEAGSHTLRRVVCPSPSGSATPTPSPSVGATSPSATPAPTPTATASGTGCRVARWAGTCDAAVAGAADSAAPLSALFNAPAGLAWGAAALYVADAGNRILRAIYTNGSGTGVVAGLRGVAGAQDGFNNTLTSPAGLALHTPASPLLYFSDSHRVRALNVTSLNVTTVAGSGVASALEGVGTAATFNAPRGLCAGAVQPELLFVVDTGNNKIRVIALGTATVSTAAGSGAAGAADGPSTAATFNGPRGCALDAPMYTLYVADTIANKIRAVDLTSGNFVTTLAGSGTATFANGVALFAAFSAPHALAVDSGGVVVVVDTNTNTLRSVVGGGVGTVAGSGAPGALDGWAASATFRAPTGLALSAAGEVYVSDGGNNCVRRLICASLSPSITPSASGTPGTVSNTPSPPPTTSSTPSTGATQSCTPTGTVTRTVTITRSPTVSRTLTRTSSGTLSGTPSLTGTPTLSPSPSGVGCTLSVFAGTGIAGTASSTTSFNTPRGLAVDDGAAQLLYVSDSANNAIKAVTLGGAVMSLVAGSSAGTAGFVNNAVGTSSTFWSPQGLALLSGVTWGYSGTFLVVADNANHALRMVDVGGTRAVTTLAGNGTVGWSNGLGSSATFFAPAGVAVRNTGPIAWVVYVADTANHLIRAVDASGAVSVLAGRRGISNPFSNGYGVDAVFTNPTGIAWDAAAGLLYVSDASGFRLRTVSPTGNVGPLAGTGVSGTVDAPLGAGVGFSNPVALAVAPMRSLLVVEGTAGHRLRLTALPGGATTTLAGTGVAGSASGLLQFTTLNDPRAVAVSAAGPVYVAESTGQYVRVLSCPGGYGYAPSASPSASPGTSPTATPTVTGSVSPSVTATPTATATYAGCTVMSFVGGPATVNVIPYAPGGLGPGMVDGNRSVAKFNSIRNLVVDRNEVVYVADNTNLRIRRVDPQGNVTTIAGSISCPANNACEGVGTNAMFASVPDLAFDVNQTTLYVPDGSSGYNRVRSVFIANSTTVPVGVVGTFCGGINSGFAEGVGVGAVFNRLSSIAIDTVRGIMYVGDTNNCRVRKVLMPPALPIVTTYAGNGANGYVDGFGSAAAFSTISSVAVDEASGFVFTAENGMHRIRMISYPGGFVSTLAGRGVAGWQDGVGVDAMFNSPNRVHVDLRTGSVLVADTGNFVLRSIAMPSGAVTTIVGVVQTAGYQDGNSLTARFNSQVGVFTTPLATYIADISNYVIRKVVCPSQSPTPTPTGTASPGSSPSTTPSATPSSTPSNTPTPSATGTGAGCASAWVAGAVGAAGCVDGTLFTARFNAPRTLTVSGSLLLVADQACHTVRAVALDANTVVTLAGQASAAGWADGVGTNAQFSSPQGAAADGTGNGLLVADTGNHAIRLVTLSTGAVISLAGKGVGCFVDDVGPAACFNSPFGVSLAPYLGTVALVADSLNCRLRSMNLATRAVVTFAGVACGSGIVDGPRGYGSFSTQLYSVAVNGSTAYVGDAAALRAVRLDTGAVVTLAGGVVSGFRDTSMGVLALLSGSILSLTLSDGTLLVADAGNQRVRAMGLAAPYSVDTLAGSGVFGATDGPAAYTTWNNPSGLALSAGTLYVADTANRVLRSVRCPLPSGTPSPTASLTRFASPSVSPTPTVTSLPSMSRSASSTSSYVGCVVANVAGLPGSAAMADGAGGVERFNTPHDLVYKAAGDVLLVADYANHRVRAVSASGAVTTVAGTGVAGTTDGPATAAQLNGPTGLALDASGANAFISEFFNHRIRVLSATTGGLSTLAGCCGATPTAGWLDAPSVNARFNGPSGLAASPTGTWLYVADFNNHRIRAIDLLAGAAVTTLAGSAVAGNLNGVGTNAQFWNPRGLALDASQGALYVTEGHRVRIVRVSGAPTVTTLAGGGAAAGSGTSAIVAAGNAADGTGTVALYNNPWGLALQGNSVLMVADSVNNRIRSVVALPAGGALPLGLTTTVAGVGTAGAAVGPATAVASLTAARGMAINASSGVIFFTDNHAVRMLRCPPTPPPSPSPTPSVGASPAPTPTGTGTGTGSPTPTPTPSAPGFGCVVSALAGVANTAGRADGVGGNALFNGPSGLAVDTTGLLWVADRTSNTVRTVTPTGAVTTLAGNGAAGAVDGFGTSATFNAPTGIAVDATNTAWVADTTAARIRRVTPAGWVSTFAGSGVAASVDGVGTGAQFSQPTGIAVTRLAGPVTAFVTDVNTHRVRAVAFPSAEVTTIAGTGVAGAANGVGLGASFNTPRGLALDASETILYVSDTLNYRIRRIALATLAVTTLTPGTSTGCSDVAGTLGLPSHIALDASGSLLVADAAASCFVVRRVTAAGAVWTVAGRGAAGAAVGAGEAAAFTLPFGVAVDSSTGSGAIYVSDQQSHVVRRLVCPTASPSASPTPTPSPGASSSGTPTPTPSLTPTFTPTPTQTSTNNGCILSTLAGSALSGTADGPGAAASFVSPFSLVTSPSQGLLLVTDRAPRLRSIALDGSAQVATLTGAAGLGYLEGTPTYAKFNSPGQADWVGGGGAFLVTDTTNNRIRLVSAALATTTLAGSGAAAWQDGLGSKSCAHPRPSAPEKPRKSLKRPTLTLHLRALTTHSRRGFQRALRASCTARHRDGICVGLLLPPPALGDARGRGRHPRGLGRGRPCGWRWNRRGVQSTQRPCHRPRGWRHAVCCGS